LPICSGASEGRFTGSGCTKAEPPSSTGSSAMTALISGSSSAAQMAPLAPSEWPMLAILDASTIAPTCAGGEVVKSVMACFIESTGAW
jgi:hypothetical protein